MRPEMKRFLLLLVWLKAMVVLLLAAATHVEVMVALPAAPATQPQVLGLL